MRFLLIWLPSATLPEPALLTLRRGAGSAGLVTLPRIERQVDQTRRIARRGRDPRLPYPAAVGRSWDD